MSSVRRSKLPAAAWAPAAVLMTINNPPWLPADAPPAQRVWRLKVYAMQNDPSALLRRVVKDFPAAAVPKPVGR